MATWADFQRAEPELAGKVRERFDIRKHKTLATIRADGSPRISGVEVEFEADELLLGMMPGSRKAADLSRDPRLAIHSPTEDPPENVAAPWRGEAKIAGQAREVDCPGSPVPGARRFRVEISEASFVHLNAAGDRLVIESWSEARGLQVLERE